jgi:hypothetical protein
MLVKGLKCTVIFYVVYEIYLNMYERNNDRLCGLVVGVLAYRSRGPG